MLKELLGYVSVLAATTLGGFAAYSLYLDSPHSKLQRSKLFVLIGIIILFTTTVFLLIQRNNELYKALVDALALFYRCLEKR